MWVSRGQALGATHLGSNAAKKQFRDRLRQIMKQASWSDDKVVAGLEELEAIVPSAESIVKEIWVGVGMGPSVHGSIVTGMGGLAVWCL